MECYMKVIFLHVTFYSGASIAIYSWWREDANVQYSAVSYITMSADHDIATMR